MGGRQLALSFLDLAYKPGMEGSDVVRMAGECRFWVGLKRSLEIHEGFMRQTFTIGGQCHEILKFSRSGRLMQMEIFKNPGGFSILSLVI